MLNLPTGFVRLLADRQVLDAYQASCHLVEAVPGPVPTDSLPTRNRNAHYLRIIEPRIEPPILDYRREIQERFLPLRGYRAPILERAALRPPTGRSMGHLTMRERQAAAHVAQRLAHDGLRFTLIEAIRLLGPEEFTANPASGITVLENIGLPVDLLACFPLGAAGDAANPASELVRHVAAGLTEKKAIAALKSELDALRFHYAPADGAFRAATECGQSELGLIRTQAGGGMQDGGVVPGASLDMISQIANAFPDADLLISVPDIFLQPFHQIAGRAWRLRRTNHVTIVSELLPVAAWAQDNGKAGVLESSNRDGASSRRLATLTPRYASIDEGKSTFQPGESFLMDGLRAAGHSVLHSRLLFQGGNLLVACEPASGRRVLYLGEGELHRNVALGLSRAEVLEAFRVEFGVEHCEVLPAASYHLDFDVTFRRQADRPIAFVNDTMAAARIVVRLGVESLERQAVLDPAAASSLRAALEGGHDQRTVEILRAALARDFRPGTGYSALLARRFVSSRVDSAAGNLQCFLLALDWLESSLPAGEATGAGSGHRKYLKALRNLQDALLAQRETLQKLGWKVVGVPSLPDLYRGINYVNGIQHRDGYIMPAFGGFYSALDQAAQAVFQRELSAGLKITLIQSAESQRQHGGVHCTVAAYPKL